MRARYFVPYLNRWIQPDTIILDPTNPQNLNRYTYVSNNPLKYTDPSGHLALGENNEGDYFLTMMLLNPELETEFYQGNNYSPVIDVELPVEVEVYNMPKPCQTRQVGDLQKRMSFVGQVYGIAIDIEEIFGILTPGEQSEDLFGWFDFLVTGMTDYVGNKTYSGYPIPGKPRMLVIGQDTLVNLADAAVGSGATVTSLPAAAIASIFGPQTAGAVQYAWEMVIDGSSTLASIANDSLSLIGEMPTFINLGIYVQDGWLHVAILVYPVDF